MGARPGWQILTDLTWEQMELLGDIPVEIAEGALRDLAWQYGNPRHEAKYAETTQAEWVLHLCERIIDIERQLRELSTEGDELTPEGKKQALLTLVESWGRVVAYALRAGASLYDEGEVNEPRP